ncbi:MAG: radical SAM family heme chaperone HemW [Muribaculaceae bacterium]|nr:radical SAM family heme chaperone HemW [Muribaculaceae bacterium]
MAGLYIHIPFCHSKCIYCDFYSMPQTARLDALLDALAREYELRRDEITAPFTTVYIGGGTPSIVDPAKLARLCKALPMSDAEEFTIEVNPEDVTAERIKAWRDIGINRISMGIQSFDDNELHAIRRRHSAADVMKALDMLLEGGINNISCDLIYGLPGQSLMSWQDSLKRLLDYRLPHISAYCLSYEPGTALHVRMSAGKVTPTDDETLEIMYSNLCRATADAGYEHYEISNFSLPGMRSRHNSSYWTGTPYLGLGPGAHSYDGKTRRFNPGKLKEYIDSASITVVDEETENERFNDLLITALRTADGLDFSELTPERAEYLNNAVKPFIANGQIITNEIGRLRISEAAWFRSDAILRELIIA